MEPIFCPVKKCPIIYIDSGVEKCESGFANSIIPVPPIELTALSGLLAEA
jgi:hypothetical protein